MGQRYGVLGEKWCIFVEEFDEVQRLRAWRVFLVFGYWLLAVGDWLLAIGFLGLAAVLTIFYSLFHKK
jgi:hypothetical protein